MNNKESMDKIYDLLKEGYKIAENNSLFTIPHTCDTDSEIVMKKGNNIKKIKLIKKEISLDDIMKLNKMYK